MKIMVGVKTPRSGRSGDWQMVFSVEGRKCPRSYLQMTEGVHYPDSLTVRQAQMLLESVQDLLAEATKRRKRSNKTQEVK